MTKPSGSRPRRARDDKRQAILRAAIEVFAREGYAHARIDEIARLADVAEPTLYTRFGDKATLFTEAVADATARSNQEVLDVIDTASTRPDSLRTELEQLGTALVGCVIHDDGAAVMRLQMTEHAMFGEAFGKIRAANRERILDRLAGKLAQLATAGRLRLTDPQRAARHFLALVSDDALTRSGYGITPLTADDLRGPVAEAVDTFLAAFGPEEHSAR
jgi:TetR/AcrR family transcriptional repressor of mexJK operon